MVKQMICISCPMGCHLTVDDTDKNNIIVTGNTCPRGVIYAKNEVTAPKRMVTGTAKVSGSDKVLVSVKTREAIPKELIFDCLAQIKATTAVAPVSIGDVIISNVCGCGVDVVATSGAKKV